jgi:hypothetical protein
MDSLSLDPSSSRRESEGGNDVRCWWGNVLSPAGTDAETRTTPNTILDTDTILDSTFQPWLMTSDAIYSRATCRTFYNVGGLLSDDPVGVSLRSRDPDPSVQGEHAP